MPPKANKEARIRISNGENRDETPVANRFEVGETSNGGVNVTRGELDQAVTGLTQQLEIANKAMLTKLDSLFALQAATAKVASKSIRAEDAGSSSSSPNREKSFQEISNPGKGKPDNSK